MSEVKVRITAQNETQTGFQSVLSDAKKTAGEVKRTFSQATTAPSAMQPQQAAGSGGGFDARAFYDDAINKAEQQIETNLAKRKAAREAAAQAERAANADSESSIMSLVGRFAILAGAAVLVGKAISEGFQRIADAFQAATDQSKQFASALQAAGTATSLEGAIAGFKSLNAITEQTKATLDELQGKTMGEAVKNAIQGRPGQLFSRAASLVGAPGANDLQKQKQRQQTTAREMLTGSLERRATMANELLAAGSDEEAIAKVQREQKNRAEIENLKNALQNQDQAVIDSRVAQLEEVHKLEQQIEETRLRASKIEKSGTRKGNVIGEQLGPGNIKGIEEMQRERQAAARALGPEFGPGTADAAAGGFRVDAALFQQQQAEEAARAIMANQQDALQGSGASSLQRIGGASTESFRFRPEENREQKRANEYLKQISDALKRGEPLVLRGSN